MIEQLASLLLPIDGLLAQIDFNPQTDTSPEIVTLFRNMWFLCILFHFTSNEDKEDTAMEWQRPALARIAAKTPFIVLEEVHESLSNELEYNSVIRHEYAHTVSLLHRIKRVMCLHQLSRSYLNIAITSPNLYLCEAARFATCHLAKLCSC
jgi:phosphatidylinositol 4-kinase